MHTVGIKRFDAQGRIVISDLFKKGNMPKEVYVMFNTNTADIEIIDAEKTNFDNVIKQKVDSKNRVCIPAWLRDEIKIACSPNSPKLFVMLDNKNNLHLKIGKNLF